MSSPRVTTANENDTPLEQLSLEQGELEAEILKAQAVLADLISKKKKIDDKIKMANRRTTKKNNRTSPQLINGQIVVLNSGKGAKRKCNGHEAEVLEYPSRGCWMTVAVREHGTVYKWRKGQCSMTGTMRGIQRSQKQLLQVSDNVLATIFSFLGSSHDSYNIVLDENGREQQRHQLPFVKDAGIVYSKLTRVSKTWRRVCNENAPLIFGRLNVNLDALPVKKIVTCIHWLCKHKFSIGSLIFRAELGDVLFLEQLLNKCDTSKLTFIRAYCKSVDAFNRYNYHDRPNSRWVSEAYHHENEDLKGWVIDLCGDTGAVSLEAMSRAVDVPYCFPAPTQRQLHDTIAANCEKLLELEVSIAIPNAGINCREYLSESLFSLKNIYRLEVSLGVVKSQFNSCHFDGMIVTRMVENLEKIRELTIKGCEGSTGNRQLFIASPTLTALNVSGLCKLSWISGALPRLETFSCKGGWYGNGTVPQFTAEQLQHVRYVELDNDEYSRQDCHFYAGEATIPRLDVPPTCEFIMSCGGAVDMPWVIQNFLNGRFETFE
jgi:hypothetical protein